MSRIYEQQIGQRMEQKDRWKYSRERVIINDKMAHLVQMWVHWRFVVEGGDNYSKAYNTKSILTYNKEINDQASE